LCHHHPALLQSSLAYCVAAAAAATLREMIFFPSITENLVVVVFDSKEKAEAKAEERWKKTENIDFYD